MKTLFTKRLFNIPFILLFTFLLSATVMAETYTATTMRLLHYEGTVEIMDSSGKSSLVMENIRFNSGDSLHTGAASSASVGMDSTKIVTLDENTKVEFTKQSNAMKLSLSEGSFFLDVSEKLKDNESLDIKTSTMTVGIRGTIVLVSTVPIEEYQNRLSLKTEGGQVSSDPASSNQADAEGISLSSLEEKIMQASANGGVVSMIGVLEGNVQMDYRDENGKNVKLDISSGQKATLMDSNENGMADVDPEVNKVTAEDIFGAANDQIQNDPVIQDRLQKAGVTIPSKDNNAGNASSYPANGDWTITSPVSVVAQSASKMFDGSPLTRSTDVLVQGLPNGFTCRATAGGSRTDAGSGENPISSCVIYNQQGENVTSHFTNIQKVSGKLTIDPAPLTAWSGSAEKVYDGTPLTSTETKLTFSPGYEKISYARKNLSYVITEKASVIRRGVAAESAAGSNNSAATSQSPQSSQTSQQSEQAQSSPLNESQTLYGICGTVLVHGSNPLTQEIKEINLSAGQRLTVFLSDKNNEESIDYVIETITEDEVPEDILRIYADNPEILTQACTETGWNVEKLNERIKLLPPLVTASSDVNGVKMNSQTTDNLMEDCTNVRITIDTEVTNYNNRALNKEEAHYTPMKADPSIKIVPNASITDVGTVSNTFTIDWGSAHKENYKLSEQYGTLTVTPAPATVTTGSAEKEYDGTPLTNSEASISGLVHGETATVTATGSITNVGSKSNSYSIDWGSAKEKNYNVSSDTGTLKVTASKAEVSIRISVAGKTYDGKPLDIDTVVTSDDSGDTVETASVQSKSITAKASSASTQDGISNTVSVEGLPSGFTLKAHITGSRTDAGSSELKIESYQIFDEDGKDVTDHFSNVEIVESTLTIDPAPAAVTTGSASKEYDGKALTSSEASVSGLVDADKDTVKVNTTGSITDVGTAENTYTIDWGTAKESNYTLSENIGTLEVTENSTEISFTAPSRSKTYDGSALQADTAGDVTAAGLPEGFTFTASASGSQTDAGSSETAVASYKILNADEKDVTANFTNIKTEKGSLTVTPADAALTTGSASKEYDGKELTSAEASITGLADADKAAVTVTATGTITKVGSAENTYSIDWGTAKSSNYTLSENIGTLEVTKNNTEITFTSASAEKVYDGTPLIATGVTVEGLPEEFTYICSGGGPVDVGADAGTYENYFNDMEYSYTDENGVEWVGWRYAVIKNADGEDVTDYFSNIKFVRGTLTIKPLDVVFELNSYNADFNGQKVLPDGFKAAYGDGSEVEEESINFEEDAFHLPVHLTSVYNLTGGGKIQIDVDGYSDAGTYDYEPVKTFLAGTESNYNISFTNTGVTISPLTVNLTLKDGSGVYDGTYHSAELTGASCGDKTATVTSISDTEWNVYGYTVFTSETITVKIEGGGTKAGEYPLTYSYSFGNNDPDNYNIVTPSIDKIMVEALEITISMTSPVYDYDRRTHGSGVPELKYENGPQKGESPTPSTMMSNDTGSLKGEYILSDGVTMTVRSGGEGPDAGTYTLPCTQEYSDGADSGNYKVNVTGNTLTINKLTAVVTTGSATGPSGTMYPVTSDEASITGLADADVEYVTITATGEQWSVGSSDNTYSIEWGTDDHPVNKDNYIIDEQLGTLTMFNAVITPPEGSLVPSKNKKTDNPADPAESGSAAEKDETADKNNKEADTGNNEKDAVAGNNEKDSTAETNEKEAAPGNNEKDAAAESKDDSSPAGESGDDSKDADQAADQADRSSEDKSSEDKEGKDSKADQPDKASESVESNDSKADQPDKASESVESNDSKPDQPDKTSDNSESPKKDAAPAEAPTTKTEKGQKGSEE